MVRSKAPAKKQQIDFKVLLFRVLAPSLFLYIIQVFGEYLLAIIILEQSVAAEKNGFATSNQGLTLEELLHRTSHHNANVRKHALLGIQEIFKSHPEELQGFINVDALRDRICDGDEQVRKAFYKLFKTQIFPSCKEEDKQHLTVSFLILSIFLAMANTSIDVRLMAFDVLHLVVEFYPPTFSLYAEKVFFFNYKDIIIQINYLYVQDKSNLKSALSGLTHCLSLLPCDDSDNQKVILQNQPLLAYKQDDPAIERFANVSAGSLKEIKGALINCFPVFIPLLHAPRGLDLDAHPLIDCVDHILRSICYAFKFSIHRHAQGQTVSEEEVALMNKLLGYFPPSPGNNISKKNGESYFILNGVLTEIFWKQSISKPIQEKTLLALLPFVPKLTVRVNRDWRDNLMQAFTITLCDCKAESPLKLACISVVRDLIIPNGDIIYPNDPTANNYQRTWAYKLPSILSQLGDKHPVSSQVVMRLLLDLARFTFLKNASPTFEEDVRNFIYPYQGEAFASLPREAQDLAISFLHYWIMDKFTYPLLRAITSCCICESISHSFPFLMTQLWQNDDQKTRNLIIMAFCFIAESRDVVRGTLFNEFTNLVCKCLSEMGDRSLLLQIIEKVLVEKIILKPALDNGCGILRIICKLDSKPTRLSESSVTTLTEFLPGYLMDIVNCIPEDKENSYFLHRQPCFYYLLPYFFLFDWSSKLTEAVLKRMRLLVSEETQAMLESLVQQDSESSRSSLNVIQCIVSVILLMHNDVKVRKIISSFKLEIDLILHNVITLQSSSLTIEEIHMIKIVGERLRIASNSLVSSATVTKE
ncbi:unnamed protein product [Eruca vesicaria subsp. sativa]|uniref:TEX10-like TPR repeats domain-containing protein n=1 Tax=Eruca vesicaria subsp. sativa TaxID=29727 RepID=A0ABC8K8K3_ERUVS|nr:unnamed protein product [Eruca vesicaria subsp. sativa]